MRELVLDIETTGLDISSGHRVIEIGIVELINRSLTGSNFHCYINPERDSDPDALKIHGLTTFFLSTKPKFSEIASEFINYLNKDVLIIHNAQFDISFLQAELQQLNIPFLDKYCNSIIDTLMIAKQIFPGKRNSLNALCERFNINYAHRNLHGALLDAELLADVYLKMTCIQKSFEIDDFQRESKIFSKTPMFSYSTDIMKNNNVQSFNNLKLPIIKANDQELSDHQIILNNIELITQEICVWYKN